VIWWTWKAVASHIFAFPAAQGPRFSLPACSLLVFHLFVCLLLAAQSCVWATIKFGQLSRPAVDCPLGVEDLKPPHDFALTTG